MTEANQILLLKHYRKIADNITKDSKNKDFKPIIRENARLHAAEIIEKNPGIEDKIPAEDPVEEEVVEEEKEEPKSKKSKRGK